MIALWLGLAERSSATAAERCAAGAGLDGTDERQASLLPAGIRPDLGSVGNGSVAKFGNGRGMGQAGPHFTTAIRGQRAAQLEGRANPPIPRLVHELCDRPDSTADLRRMCRPRPTMLCRGEPAGSRSGRIAVQAAAGLASPLAKRAPREPISASAATGLVWTGVPGQRWCNPGGRPTPV